MGPTGIYDYLLDNVRRLYRDYYRDLHYAGPAHQMVDDFCISACGRLFRIGIFVFAPQGYQGLVFTNKAQDDWLKCNGR